MKLSMEAFELAQVNNESLKFGQEKLSDDLGSWNKGGRRAQKNKAYNEYIEEHLVTGDLTTQGFADHFHVGVETARLQFIKRDLEYRNKRWIKP